MEKDFLSKALVGSAPGESQARPALGAPDGPVRPVSEPRTSQPAVGHTVYPDLLPSDRNCTARAVGSTMYSSSGSGAASNTT